MPIAILTPPTESPRLEITAAVQRAGMEVLDFSWDEREERLAEAEAYVLVADSPLNSAAPAAQTLAGVLQAQNLHGKAVLGLGCGGAKLLAESGLVPGLYKNLQGLSVYHPECNGGMGDKGWIRPAEDYQYNAFTRELAARPVLPVQRAATARFFIPPGLLTEMRSQGLTVFLDCDVEGRPLAGNNIAAVANKAGTVLALLAYPEDSGLDLLFQSLRDHLASGYIERIDPLYYWPRK